MRGIGEELSAPLDLPPLAALLVNPGVALATRDVFARFAALQGSKTSPAGVPRERDALIEWLGEHGNDLTPSAIACVPVIADVLTALRALPGARLARMSGSGPTCFALFASPGEAAAAAQRLKTERKDWWVHPDHARFGGKSPLKMPALQGTVGSPAICGRQRAQQEMEMKFSWIVIAVAAVIAALGVIAADPALARAKHKAQRQLRGPAISNSPGACYSRAGPSRSPNGCSPPVYTYGQFIGQDPDRNIRIQLLRDPTRAIRPT